MPHETIDRRRFLADSAAVLGAGLIGDSLHSAQVLAVESGGAPKSTFPSSPPSTRRVQFAAAKYRRLN
jgi:hypothetical protein